MVLYDQAVHSKACGKFCAPGATGAKASSVQVIDLDHIGQPNVVLNLYTGGAHCCSVQQIFTFDPGTMTYAETEHDFGDPGARIEDLNHDGRFEFVTADDRFAYAFTDFAASGLPLQILTFTGSRFQDVTNSYPALIRKDAATWLKAFRQLDHGHDIDSVGVIAAWAADEYRLGKVAAANRYLHQQADGRAPQERRWGPACPRGRSSWPSCRRSCAATVTGTDHPRALTTRGHSRTTTRRAGRGQSPAASRSASALSVCSQVKSGSSRPKWP